MKRRSGLRISWTLGALVAMTWALVLVDGATRSAWANRFHPLADLKRGDCHEGLADLKLFLSKFGYTRIFKDVREVPPAEFDESLEAAVKLYQTSFNLPITGVICKETLRVLHTPRCGREDVSHDGHPLMLLQPKEHNNKIELPTSTAQVGHGNFESLWAVFSPSGKWQSTHNLTFAFSLNHMPPFLPANRAKAAISAAFDTWSAVVPVNFTEVSTFTEAHIQIKFVGGDHGDGDPFDGRLGILAHSFPPEDGRFHFDSDEVWITTNDMSIMEDEDAIDLQTVALHEIGHLLGLAHTQIEGAVMYPSIVLGQVKRELTRDDVAGAQALYGSKYRRLTSSCRDINSKQDEVLFSAAFGDDT